MHTPASQGGLDRNFIIFNTTLREKWLWMFVTLFRKRTSCERELCRLGMDQGGWIIKRLRLPYGVGV